MLKSMTTSTRCLRSQQLRGRKFFVNIFAINKKFAKLFSPVHMGLKFLTQNMGRNSYDTGGKLDLTRDTGPLTFCLTLKNNQHSFNH